MDIFDFVHVHVRYFSISFIIFNNPGAAGFRYVLCIFLQILPMTYPGQVESRNCAQRSPCTCRVILATVVATGGGSFMMDCLPQGRASNVAFASWWMLIPSTYS
jgi:hypothetical protein